MLFLKLSPVLRNGVTTTTKCRWQKASEKKERTYLLLIKAIKSTKLGPCKRRSSNHILFSMAFFLHYIRRFCSLWSLSRSTLKWSHHDNVVFISIVFSRYTLASLPQLRHRTTEKSREQEKRKKATKLMVERNRQRQKQISIVKRINECVIFSAVWIRICTLFLLFVFGAFFSPVSHSFPSLRLIVTRFYRFCVSAHKHSLQHTSPQLFYCWYH